VRPDFWISSSIFFFFFCISNCKISEKSKFAKFCKLCQKNLPNYCMFLNVGNCIGMEIQLSSKCDQLDLLIFIIFWVIEFQACTGGGFFGIDLNESSMGSHRNPNQLMGKPMAFSPVSYQRVSMKKIPGRLKTKNNYVHLTLKV